MPDSPSIHISVMPREVLEGLQPATGKIICDGTLGGAGHTRLLAERVIPGGRIISCDRDLRPVEAARLAFANPVFGESSAPSLPVTCVQANFAELPAVLQELEIPAVDGVLLDLGLSSDQLADGERGFSFAADGPLDLRFDVEEGNSAAELLRRLPEKALADLIYEYGEERLSRRIARQIVEQRRKTPIETAGQLAELVRRCYPGGGRDSHIHPATRTFQALRIAVNDELGSLDRALRDLPDILKPGGRLAIISFHSLEDRRVKEAFRGDDRLRIITKKPLRPTDAEVFSNPRSRSAKLRVAERVS